MGLFYFMEKNLCVFQNEVRFDIYIIKHTKWETFLRIRDFPEEMICFLFFSENNTRLLRYKLLVSDFQFLSIHVQ